MRHAMAWHALERLPVEQDMPRRVAIDTADAVEQRRLSGAVGADQAADLIATDIERNPGKGNHTAEANLHAADGQQRVRRSAHTIPGTAAA